MQLLDLPADVFRGIVSCAVQQLGLTQSMRLRITCRTLADEILDAIITTRVVEQVAASTRKRDKIEHRLDLIARYLHHRVSTERPGTHSWIVATRDTSRTLAKLTKSEHDAAGFERLERNACACLAAQHRSAIFDNVERIVKSPKQFEGGMEGNCLTVAAWMGDLDLVKSLHTGSDPLAFFGRPSWAAATQGHRDIVQFCIDQGALPYEPTDPGGRNLALYRSPLAAAAYMGHQAIVQLYLQQEYYRSSDEKPDEDLAVYFAARGNQIYTLKITLDHIRAKAQPQWFLSVLDWALVCSCECGALKAAKVALEYGADPNETDFSPRSCLELAAISGSAPLVKMLLDAGAEIEVSNLIRRRALGIREEGRRYKDALLEAKKGGYSTIVRMIEEKQRILAGEANKQAT